MRLLVTVATYNEIINLPQLVDEVFAVVPHASLLVVDDNSPDGTGEWCRGRSESDPRLQCLHRPGKLGLGTATIAAMRYAIERDYELMLNLDADFSHDPRRIPDLIAAIEHADIAIGSRYVSGGRTEGWPLHRRIMSTIVNRFVRTWLSLAVLDCSGAFRCYRVSVLERLDLGRIKAKGYSIQEELLWRLSRQGCRLAEVPITFADRREGQSKMDLEEAISTISALVSLRLAR